MAQSIFSNNLLTEIVLLLALHNNDCANKAIKNLIIRQNFIFNYIITELIINNKIMETKNEYEYKHLRVCEKWLQIESCRKCLFEVLCHYEKMKKENEKKSDLDQ